MKKNKCLYITFLILLIGFTSCSAPESKNRTAFSDSAQAMIVKPFGKMRGGREVNLYTIKNKNDMKLSVINYGGIIVSLKVPDKNGLVEEVALGFDSLAPYLKDDPFFGALIGRYGNRIAKGKFSIDGIEYSLPINNGVNHLHGGPNGFYNVYWDIEAVKGENPSLKLTYLSKDGEEGYPGNLNSEVIYTLTDNNELEIAYRVTTDKKTIVNPTQHTYFNLSGNVKKDILDHELMIAADKFLPVDSTLIPTGKLRKVEGTPFDFRKATAIGERINQENLQLKYGFGYDHCWIFINQTDTLKKVASLYEPVSGRLMDVLTSEPSIQFYSGNFLNGKPINEGGTIFRYRYGLCLETQHFPDSPNQPSFPSTVLNPGEIYTSQTVYRFSVK